MLKRKIALLLCMLLMGGICVTALAANTMQQGSMYVNTANGKALRFRSSKSTSADNILAEIPYGTKVYVLSWDGTWARIRYNSAVGYVVKKHLSIARPEPYTTVQSQRRQAEEIKQEQKAEKEAARKAENELKAQNKKLDKSKIKDVEPYDVSVLTGGREIKANLYAKASLLSKILATYSEGVRLEVHGKNKDWAKVYHGGTDMIGYMLLEELVEDITEDELLEDE